jgi:hypothetical protein
LRKSDQEEDNEKFKTDKVFLCTPWLRSLADTSVSSGKAGKLLLSSLWFFLHISFKRVVGIAIVIVPGCDLRKEVVFFTGWGMYFGKRSFFNIPWLRSGKPESEVFQYLLNHREH